MGTDRAQQRLALAYITEPMPSAVRSEIVLDEEFCRRFKLRPKFWLRLDEDHHVETDSLHDAIRAALAGRKTASILLRDGRRINVKLASKSGNATIILGKRRFNLSDSDLLGGSREVRRNALNRVIETQPLLPGEENKWRTILQRRGLKNREFVDLMTELSETPEAFSGEFSEPRNFGPDDLMPDSLAYYIRLVLAFAETADLDLFIKDQLAEVRKEFLNRHSKAALRRIAFAALSQSLIPFDLLDSMKVEDIAELLDADDPFSLLCGFELCCAFVSKNRRFVTLGSKFLQKLLADGKAGMARCNRFSALGIVSIARLRQRAGRADAPVFWVRLAALAHAGVLTDALCGILDTEGFLKWAADNFFPAYLWNCTIDLQAAPRWQPELESRRRTALWLHCG
jgi:hypothetical protein